MEFDEFHPMTYDDKDHHAVHLCTLRMELHTANRNAVLVEDKMEDIEAWDLNDTMYSLASDDEFPLLIKVNDDNNNNKNSDDEDIIEDSMEGYTFTRIEEDLIRDFPVWSEEDEPDVTGINNKVDNDDPSGILKPGKTFIHGFLNLINLLKAGIRHSSIIASYSTLSNYPKAQHG